MFLSIQIKRNLKEEGVSIMRADLSYMMYLLFSKFSGFFFNVDETALKEFAEGYIGPLKRFLLWMIPLGVAVYCLIKAIDWWRKDVESDGQSKSYWATVTKGVTVGIIAWSIDLILTILGIGG